MLMVATATQAPVNCLASQKETPGTDIEIWRRVMEIRAGWSVSERVRRRREAENRFAMLLESLSTDLEVA